MFVLVPALESSKPFHRAVQRLLTENASETEQTRDEEVEEAGKLAASVQSSRRSSRRHGSQPGQPRPENLAPSDDSPSLSHSLRHHTTARGELARRNGIGANLRC